MRADIVQARPHEDGAFGTSDLFYPHFHHDTKAAARDEEAAAEAAAAAAAQTAASEDPQWGFIQSFGDDAAGTDDLITSMAISGDGQWLAAGDNAGRVCVFGENIASAPAAGAEHEGQGGGGAAPAPATDSFEFWFEFQSHDKDFDSLRSKMIDERVLQVQWLNQARPGPSRLLLAANTKTVKLWRLDERRGERRARLGRTYSGAHTYDIHSVSACSDGATFLTADDLRINVWDLERGDTTFTALDDKPNELAALQEVLTAANYHPSRCHTLVTGTSSGRARVYDTRQRALLSSDAAVQIVTCSAAATQSGGATSYRGVAGSVTDARFVGEHRLCTRDFLTVKVWDERHTAAPLHESQNHDYLEPHLGELYENGCVFDRFTASASADGQRMVTGSYGNRFVVHNTSTGASETIVAQDEVEGRATRVSPHSNDATEVDLAQKALHTAWHPTRDVLAVASVNKIYFYSATAAPKPTA